MANSGIDSLTWENLLQPLSKNFWKILGGTGSAVLLGFILAKTLPKKYDCEGLLTLATSPQGMFENFKGTAAQSTLGIGSVLDPSAIAEFVTFHFLDRRHSGKDGRVTDVSISKISKGSIRITTTGSTPEVARAELENVLDTLQRRYQPALDHRVTDSEKRLAAIEGELESHRLTKEAAALALKRSATSSVALTDLARLVEKDDNFLNSAHDELLYTISQLKGFNFRTNADITYDPGRPRFPSVALFVVFAFVLGLLVSVTVAYAGSAKFNSFSPVSS